MLGKRGGIYRAAWHRKGGRAEAFCPLRAVAKLLGGGKWTLGSPAEQKEVNSVVVGWPLQLCRAAGFIIDSYQLFVLQADSREIFLLTAFMVD